MVVSYYLLLNSMVLL